MHVVLVGDYPRDPGHIGGGVEAHVLYLSQALQDYPDLKLDVVTLDKWGLEQRTVNHKKVTVHYVPFALLPSRLSVLGNIRRMRVEISRLKPDLVHAHVAGAYAEAAAQTGLPWVLTLHGIRFLEARLRPGLLNRYRGWVVAKEELRSVKQARHVISINPFIPLTFNGHISGQVYDIKNPVYEPFFHVTGQSQPGRTLFAGRLIPRKGVHTLLRAFAELHRRMPEATLRLAGGDASAHAPTPYYQDLKQFVADAGLEKAVTFLGEVSQATLLEEYAACSALVLSSVLETAPMVITQAMAAGRAVISTDAGGARYMVEHGQTGLIVPCNDEQALGEAMLQLLSNETRLREMGRCARVVAERCSHPSVVAAQTRAAYYHILGQVPPQVNVPNSLALGKEA
ncbi:MAG TPA: glycosyltransferase family 4 protein [Anaerolineae bacterium]|nr:glycosyltransferase family 4 protein [Anaerolineae bacterium]